MSKLKAFLKERMQQASKNQKGFSLVELIIVIAILGIIAAIALPNITGVVDNARRNADLTNAKSIANAAVMAKAKDDSLKLNSDTGAMLASKDDAEDTLIPAIISELNSIPTPKVSGNNGFWVKQTSEGNIEVYYSKAKVGGGNEIGNKVYPE
ncbi:MAG: prepilin-type N-terminal cleavage/methylation domain-containing protein [Niameybacter sp.]